MGDGRRSIGINFNRRESQRFRVLRPDRSGHEQVSEKLTEQNLNARDEIISVVTCPHGRVLHHLNEVAGFCAVPGCGEPLCENCAKENVCSVSLCKRNFCIHHGRETLSGKKVCAMHGFISRLFL